MTDGLLLLNAILQNPDEDTPRLVYADWLQENYNEPLANWIRSRIASPTITTQLGPHDSVSAFGSTIAYGYRPLDGKGVYPNGQLTYRRGFAEQLDCTAEMCAKHLDTIRQTQPITLVHLTTTPDRNEIEQDFRNGQYTYRIRGQQKWFDEPLCETAGNGSIIQGLLGLTWPGITFQCPHYVGTVTAI